MRFQSFLLVSFLFVSSCHAYTVVLVSGKRLTGTLLGENSITLQLRDPVGVVLSIKKSVIDADATSRANAIVVNASPTHVISSTAPLPEKSLADIARDVRATRKGEARTYSSSDLSRVREISSSHSGDDAATSQTPEVERQEKDVQNDESYWRKTAASFRKELTGLRERKISAQFQCEKAREKRSDQIYGGKRRPTDLSQAFEEQAECGRLKELESQLSDVEWRWDEFTERARKLSIPWAWLE